MVFCTKIQTDFASWEWTDEVNNIAKLQKPLLSKKGLVWHNTHVLANFFFREKSIKNVVQQTEKFARSNFVFNFFIF